MADATKRLMPLMRTGLYIDFDLLDERQAQANHGQTLARLAERGGLNVSEALAVAQHRRWERWDFREAVQALAALKPIAEACASTATARPIGTQGTEALILALGSIRQFGQDTLSGRSDGPYDRDWLREAVKEITKRAGEALTAHSAIGDARDDRL